MGKKGYGFPCLVCSWLEKLHLEQEFLTCRVSNFCGLGNGNVVVVVVSILCHEREEVRELKRFLVFLYQMIKYI
jgi:hypothetical protein